MAFRVRRLSKATVRHQNRSGHPAIGSSPDRRCQNRLYATRATRLRESARCKTQLPPKSDSTTHLHRTTHHLPPRTHQPASPKTRPVRRDEESLLGAARLRPRGHNRKDCLPPRYLANHRRSKRKRSLATAQAAQAVAWPRSIFRVSDP